MDLSRGLITRIVDDENLSKTTRSGVTPDFLSEDCSMVFRYIQRHFSEYKSVPTRDAVQKAFPNFAFGEVKEPLEYFIDQIKETRRRNILDDKLERLSKVYTHDTQKAESLLRETISELQITQRTFRDIDAAKTAVDRYQAYLTRKANPGATGILSGWPKMDYQTLGFLPEEFAVLVGEKYMGKSWNLIWLAYKAALAGERVLFVTKEMSQDAVMRRFDSVYAHICFDSLRRGELTNVEEQRYQKALSEMGDNGISFITARQGVSTVADIEAKASEVDASIVLGDSIYLFDADESTQRSNETERRRKISTKCKEIAQRMAVPFIVSVQAGRRKTKERIPDLDDIEWSNAFSQDADTVFFLNKEDVDKELRRAHMYLLKCRDGDVVDFFIHQDFQTMDFSEREDETEPTTEVFDSNDEGIFN